MKNFINYIISYFILNNAYNQHKNDLTFNERLDKLTVDIQKGESSKYIFSPIKEVQIVVTENLLRDFLLVFIWVISSIWLTIQNIMIHDYSTALFTAVVTILILYLFVSRVKICIRMGSAYFYILLKLISSHTLSEESKNKDYTDKDRKLINNIINAHIKEDHDI